MGCTMLRQKLGEINTFDALEDWIRHDLRIAVPHAALLLTVGQTYGLGSVPTHRFAVDFPLTMVECLKNHTGAIEDPLISSWFKGRKSMYVKVVNTEKGGNRRWCETLLRFGFDAVIVDGLIDLRLKRFVILQMFNPYGGGDVKTRILISELMKDIAASVFRIIEGKRELVSGQFYGHPTLNLTATEIHIIELIAQGLSNKEIAKLRGVSDSTVKTQVQRTGAKLGATRRAEIVAIALPMLSPLPPQSLIDYDDFR
jgi:DNA-binding CsgD family transcriptional regulator